MAGRPRRRGPGRRPRRAAADPAAAGRAHRHPRRAARPIPAHAGAEELLRVRAADRSGPAGGPDASAAGAGSRTACTWSGPAPARPAEARSYQGAAARPQRHRGGRRVRHAGSAPCRPSRAERALLGRALARGRPCGGRRMRLHSLVAHRVRPVRRDRRGRPRRGRPRRAVPALGPDRRRARRRCSTRVVFAFYGTVPGVRGEEKRLRSDHAGADVRTEVTLRGHPRRRAAAGHPPARAAAAQEARGGLDHRAGQADRAALVGRRLGAGEHAHRRGLGVPAHPAGAVRRAVLPGRAAAAGGLRPVPPRRARGPRAAAAHALRRRPVRRGRGVARRRASAARRAASTRPGTR